ncbi:cysteine desulfurase family protein [Alteribacillus bidgolensis]|uniref:Cysteine desulfurase n=1 Tax=Alteribacillus bidgolensis TaxID=930129 RepID=A0A1G8N963_9BACI|nr:cysteine desulfurase family protein [Alteribacillus bidgolensis]SDI76655.1 cysteine desulfurase [Alteribacillus bidgolensis]
MKKIYADHAATTPIHSEAANVMMKVMQESFGNPSSIHNYGRKARQELDKARDQLAQTVGASPDEIVLTSGGTEADNIAIIGYAQANKDRGNHIITTKIEHHAVLHTCEKLEKYGFEVTYLPVNNEGFVQLDKLKEAITDRTILITIMHGNNEVGTLQPISQIAELASAYNIAFHSDAVQSYGLVAIDISDTPLTMMTVSSHKINGPKGAGFLYVKKGTKLTPFLTGGEQEKKRRAGTENLAAAAGFAKAAETAIQERQKRYDAYKTLSDQFLKALQAEKIPFEMNGPDKDKLPHITNVYFPNIHLESFLVQLDLAGIAASSGSACTAGSVEPSHVLSAMFDDKNRASSSVRFSFGKGNTADEMEYIAAEIRKILDRMKAI